MDCMCFSILDVRESVFGSDRGGIVHDIPARIATDPDFPVRLQTLGAVKNKCDY